MKRNPLIAVAATVGAVMVIVIVALFSRQSELEDEIAHIRSAVAATRNASVLPAQPVNHESVFPSETSHIDGTEPAASDDSVAGERERLADLERVVNGHADLIENLVAENARIAEERRRASMRAWGPEQAVGPPDTLTAGDQTSAWAPAVADGGIEWLEAEFENAADLAKIVVRQTSNPGCITKVTAIAADGAEVPVWTGVDPSTGQALADTPFAVPAGINANRVKVYLDTSKVAGWEEIDAMQIVGRDGTAQWAKSVNASSTYARSGLPFGVQTGGPTIYFNQSGAPNSIDSGTAVVMPVRGR